MIYVLAVSIYRKDIALNAKQKNPLYVSKEL